ncbi:MAG TPA: hypothetical protein P5228_02590 [Bacteroidales bacterium]|nr:hypothetical protein [Bacteroidales bacterium]HRZ50292.1 hypothetical protein [Bacteroidales bacterium]
MNPTVMGVVAAVVSLLIAFSFSSFYFKTGFRGLALKAIPLFLMVFAGFTVFGWFIGNFAGNQLESLGKQAGASLLLILGIRFLIKGITTKTTRRLFDIGKSRVLIGLLIMLNLDVLLMYTAVSVAFDTPAFPVVIIGTGGALAGLISGTAIGKRTGFLMPNLLEIITALLLGAAGILILLG